ncbi:uncharacterized protein LOC144721197 isoform X2 [Lampetra planeri]
MDAFVNNTGFFQDKISTDQDPLVVGSRSARSSPARRATRSPATPRTRAGKSAAGVCTQLWRGECGGNLTPAAPLAYLELRAGPGAAGMATMQCELAGKKQGVGGFPLTASIGDNYLCQPHDGAMRGGGRPPAVAATASCPTHARVNSDQK